MNSSEPDDTKEAEIDPSSLPGYVREQLSWYTNYTVQARRGYYSLELMAISFAGAVPVVSAAGATPWVAAVLGAWRPPRRVLDTFLTSTGTGQAEQ